MRVSSIELCNFMNHTDTVVALPASGIVSVCGPNGAGKSSLLEAVSMAGWGKTLRGTVPWPEKLKAHVRVEAASGMGICRSWSGARVNRLVFGSGAVPPTEWETVTKGQDALERIIGSWDLWRRTHVFSSADAAHFTMATDAERKRLLERLLGLEWFDDALAQARNDGRRAANELDGCRARLSLIEDRMTTNRSLIELAKKDLALVPSIDGDEIARRLESLRAMAVAARAEIDPIHEELTKQLKIGAQEDRDVSRLERRLEHLGDTCDACGQPITERVRQKMIAEIEEAKDAAAKAKNRANRALSGLRAQHIELQDEVDALKERISKCKADLANVDDAKRRYQTLASRLRDGEEALEILSADLSKGNQALRAHEVEVAELEACADILGLKGVRAQVLGRTLSSIERVANAWLSRIGSSMAIELKSYREKKGGGSTEAISLNVVKGDRTAPYLAASGGERRRTDVALLFALAEVSAGQGGEGTLFFDECLDSLDEDGVDAVIESLSEAASDRAVVVISHAHRNALERAAAQKINVASGVLVSE